MLVTPRGVGGFGWGGGRVHSLQFYWLKSQVFINFFVVFDTHGVFREMIIRQPQNEKKKHS